MPIADVLPHAARAYSWPERLADNLVHLIGLIGTLAGGTILIVTAAGRGGGPAVVSAAIYVGGLLAMFTCSALYNLWRTSRRGAMLQRLDHSAIFVMIAGSYTPFCAWLLPAHWGLAMAIAVWAVAVTGILLRLFAPSAFARFSLALYLALGWFGLVASGPLIDALDPATLTLILSGGALYSIGVIFHVWQRLPFQNVIWHGFVVTGATLHYLAVFKSIDIAAAAGTLAG